MGFKRGKFTLPGGLRNWERGERQLMRERRPNAGELWVPRTGATEFGEGSFQKLPSHSWSVDLQPQSELIPTPAPALHAYNAQRAVGTKQGRGGSTSAACWRGVQASVRAVGGLSHPRSHISAGLALTKWIFLVSWQTRMKRRPKSVSLRRQCRWLMPQQRRPHKALTLT